jgi:hypothetical protein
MSGRWVDLREAAELLGTSTEAVGKRAVGDHFALRDQLGLRAEEIQRRDLIIGQLTQANAALAARVPELEAPQTSEDGTQEPVEDAGRGKTGRGGCYGPSERVPWWRRVLGEGRLWTQRREIASCALGRLKKGSARFSG